MKRFRMFNIDLYLQPYWEGDMIYDESVMFVPEPDTHLVLAAPLLYQPAEIVSVTSADLTTRYEAKKDYIIDCGKIKRTGSGRIPVWNYDDFYCKEPTSIIIKSVSAKDRYVRYDEAPVFAQKQVLVTYKHTGKWLAEKPAYCGEKIKHFKTKLEKGKSVSIVYYGDSIMEGCDASNRWGISPHLPIFSELVTWRLQERYPGAKIQEYNTAVGGTTSRWGKDNVKERVCQYHPDLLIINFGMNDSGERITVKEYEENILAILEETQKENRQAEVLLISSSVPNPDCEGWTGIQEHYREAMENIAQNVSGVSVVPMTQMYKYLLQKKRYVDICGNCVNHPNDFVVRMYAQAILDSLIPKGSLD